MTTPALSSSAVQYMERRLPHLQNTRRGPGPRLSLSENAVHFQEMHPPLPTPEVLQCEGDQPPDAGLTQPWPHGVEEVT